MSKLVCPHCEEEVVFNKFLDNWWCSECRTHDCTEIEENKKEEE